MFEVNFGCRRMEWDVYVRKILWLSIRIEREEIEYLCFQNIVLQADELI
jgi:hypothetical protein